jgi:lipoprotein-releasing system permease protein
MYKLLLCWRYLRTRYIALASIISVMLGVAAMIVVNAVMEGFRNETHVKIRGAISDIIFESHSLDGFPDAERRMAEIREVAGEHIAGMSPTVGVPAMLGFSCNGQYVTRQILMIGLDEATYASVSNFGDFLQHPENRERLDFHLKERGYDSYDHRQVGLKSAQLRVGMDQAGWVRRREMAKSAQDIIVPQETLDANPFTRPTSQLSQTNAEPSAELTPDEGSEFDPAKEQHTGCVLGIGVCRYLTLDGNEGFLTLPGDDVEISYPTVSKPPKVLSAKFTVVDFYESTWPDYDAQFVFVPLRKLQELRGMIDPSSGVAFSTQIQIRLKDGADASFVRDLLRENFSPQRYRISTWQDREGALLAMVNIEIGILNVLLSLIVAVAGFGILAIFFMIVVEKTRDIGILKALGASNRGIMGIFLTYGFSLGVVGAGMGLVLGLTFVAYITEIADMLGRLFGVDLFDPSVYGLPRIPTIVEWLTVTLIIVGALMIAILASILPARRAARLHPVEALRYE